MFICLCLQFSIQQTLIPTKKVFSFSVMENIWTCADIYTVYYFLSSFRFLWFTSCFTSHVSCLSCSFTSCLVLLFPVFSCHSFLDLPPLSCCFPGFHCLFCFEPWIFFGVKLHWQLLKKCKHYRRIRSYLTAEQPGRLKTICRRWKSSLFSQSRRMEAGKQRRQKDFHSSSYIFYG